jgi:uncharacterized protein with ParB-like and HNH nuclease domain
MNNGNNLEVEDYTSPDEEAQSQIEEYDITAQPNDFNIRTIFDYIDEGHIIIPGFQRNYVWDKKQASKLIESIILGLPVPQIYLFQKARNKFLVIDGHQRLLSIFYFKKQRFPRRDKRAEIRRLMFETPSNLHDEILSNDFYFSEFKLDLNSPEFKKSTFNNLDYESLGEYKEQFDMRPLRNIIVKQNQPKDDDSSIYEIFNRLNTGGANLKPQEIRNSLYYEFEFYKMLSKINFLPEWRRLLKNKEPDTHMGDIEILLRCFSLLLYIDHYSRPLYAFLNKFSKFSKTFKIEDINYFENLFKSFLKACEHLPLDIFFKGGKGHFFLALFESVFITVCRKSFDKKEIVNGFIDVNKILDLSNDLKFKEASLEGTSDTNKISTRLERAKAILT